MLGLGVYESSSEDETKGRASELESKSNSNGKTLPGKSSQHEVSSKAYSSDDLEIRPASQRHAASSEHTDLFIGPSKPERVYNSLDGNLPSIQSSPFSTSRSLIHDLTFPPVPNLDIPPSPPGSPDLATNEKFSLFLSLKDQGVHFNEKLAGSSSLKNPNLLLKLRQHAELDNEQQYATSLAASLWDVSMLPTWGFKEELLKNQLDIRRKADEKKVAGRESLDFVPVREGITSRKLKATSAER
ncbi:HCNGP-like domain containing protein [Elaphomyces granulatus]